jgi:hypothetical protein
MGSTPRASLARYNIARPIRLRRVVIVNLQEFNVTQGADSRPYVEVNLENLMGPACRARNVQVRRLTVDSNGALAGCEIVERLGRGVKIFVGDMEAVPISIEE